MVSTKPTEKNDLPPPYNGTPDSHDYQKDTPVYTEGQDNPVFHHSDSTDVTRL